MVWCGGVVSLLVDAMLCYATVSPHKTLTVSSSRSYCSSAASHSSLLGSFISNERTNAGVGGVVCGVSSRKSQPGEMSGGDEQMKSVVRQSINGMGVPGHVPGHKLLISRNK
jgi:hypothetical protein